MRLDEWVRRQGVGELTRLKNKTGLAYTTVHAIYRGAQTPTFASAQALSEATGGVVTIAELCTTAQRPGRKRSGKRKRAA